MSSRRRPPPRVAPTVIPLSAAGSLHGPAIGFKPGYALPTDGLVTLTPDQAEELEEETITGPEFVPDIPTTLKEWVDQWSTLEEWVDQWYSHVVWKDAKRPQFHYFARNVWNWMINQRERTPKSPLRDPYTKEEYRVLKAIFYDRSTPAEKDKVREFERRTGWSGPERAPGADAPDAVPYGIPASPLPQRPPGATPPTLDAPPRPRREEYDVYLVRGQVYLWNNLLQEYEIDYGAEVFKRTMIRNLVRITGTERDLLQDLSVVVSERMDGLRHASAGLQDDAPADAGYRRVVFELRTTDQSTARLLANYFNDPRTGVSTAPARSYARGWSVLLGLSDVDQVVRGLTPSVKRVVINEALFDPNGDGTVVGINNPRGFHYY